MATEAKFVIPKKDAEVADLWFSTRAARLAMQKEVDALESKEAKLKAYIIDHLPASSATGIRGKLVAVTIEKKDRAELADFDAFTDFIVKNRKKGAFALLNRALNAKAIKEYWDMGQQVPGVNKVPYKTLSYSAIK